MTGAEVAAVAGVAASLIGTGSNIYAQGKLNKKNREYQQKRYEQEVADKERQWHMTNEYNAPINQIARMREAGLNPMMMYGGSSGGIAGNAASEPNAASFQNYEDKRPNFDFSGIGQYVQFRNVAAQTDNTRANTEVAKAQAEKVKADTANTNADTINKSNLDSLQKRELTLPAVETANEQLRKLQAETKAIPENVAISKQNADTNSRNADINAGNLEVNRQNAETNKQNAETNAKNADTAAYNAVSSRLSALSNNDRNTILNSLTSSQINKMKYEEVRIRLDNAMREYENYMIDKAGIKPTDPYFIRGLGNLFRKILGD